MGSPGKGGLKTDIGLKRAWLAQAEAGYNGHWVNCESGLVFEGLACICMSGLVFACLGCIYKTCLYL